MTISHIKLSFGEIIYMFGIPVIVSLMLADPDYESPSVKIRNSRPFYIA